MGKRILFIGCNFAPEPTGIGKYSGEMIEWLSGKGYDCSVVTSYPYYPQWKIQDPYARNWFWYKKEKKHLESKGKTTIYRCPTYVPANPTGKKRILLEVSFFVSALFQLLKLLFHKKHDIVVTVAPSFHSGLLGVLYKKLRKAKHIYHIQDLQIEAAQNLDMIKSIKVIDLLFKTERYIFNNTDLVTSISEGMVAKIEEKAKKRVFLFPNWADTAQFYPLPNRNELKKNYGYKPTDKLILYSGAIGEKQGLASILDCAKKFMSDPKIKFLICGTGPYKKKLQTMAEDMNLANVNFFPLQPREKFNIFLNIADIHLVIQKTQASDLVMPSKLTTILAVGGLALVTANPDSGLYSLVGKYNMGILVKAESQNALLKGIQEALLEKGHLATKANARKYAETYLDINSIMHVFEQMLLLSQPEVLRMATYLEQVPS